MSNGGRWYNEEYGGEVYYDTPSMLGAMTFWSRPRAQAQGPSGGRAEGPGRVDRVPRRADLDDAALDRLAHAYPQQREVPLQGRVRADERAQRGADRRRLAGAAGGLDEAKRKAGWTLITWLTAPEKSGWWSRATGYFAPNMGAYELPEMKEFLAKNPDAKTAVEQLAFAKPWFATYKTVAVRKAIEDELQAVLSGKKQPKEAIVDGAEDRRRDPAALCRADGAEIAAHQLS